MKLSEQVNSFSLYTYHTHISIEHQYFREYSYDKVISFCLSVSTKDFMKKIVSFLNVVFNTISFLFFKFQIYLFFIYFFCVGIFFFFFNLNFIKFIYFLKLIYNVVLVSAVAIHIHISPLFWSSFSFRFIFIHLVLNFNSYLKVGHNSFLQYGRFSPFYNPVCGWY